MTKEEILDKVIEKLYPMEYLQYTIAEKDRNHKIALKAMEEYANQQKASIVKATLEYVAQHLWESVNHEDIISLQEDILKHLNK